MADKPKLIDVKVSAPFGVVPAIEQIAGKKEILGYDLVQQPDPNNKQTKTLSMGFHPKTHHIHLESGATPILGYAPNGPASVGTVGPLLPAQRYIAFRPDPKWASETFHLSNHMDRACPIPSGVNVHAHKGNFIVETDTPNGMLGITKTRQGKTDIVTPPNGYECRGKDNDDGTQSHAIGYGNVNDARYTLGKDQKIAFRDKSGNVYFVLDGNKSAKENQAGYALTQKAQVEKELQNGAKLPPKSKYKNENQNKEYTPQQEGWQREFGPHSSEKKSQAEQEPDKALTRQPLQQPEKDQPKESAPSGIISKDAFAKLVHITEEAMRKILPASAMNEIGGIIGDAASWTGRQDMLAASHADTQAPSQVASAQPVQTRGSTPPM